VGQVTPDMLTGISYGTYILFGILTYMGAAFIWFFVPETKRLTLEEMDILFGSEGTSQADFQRMEEINNEIGLAALLRQQGLAPAAANGSDGGSSAAVIAPSTALDEKEQTNGKDEQVA